VPKIIQFSLEQFTAFAEPTTFNFNPGINVLIGANSTGKTHLMKAMYSMLKVCERTNKNQIENKRHIAVLAEENLMGVFKPNKIGHLVRHQESTHEAKIALDYDDRHIEIKLDTGNNVAIEFDQMPTPEKSVFLPVHEFLSIYPGFIAAYQERETSFDQTYYDLAVSLSASPVRGQRLEETKSLIEPLKKALSGATVSQDEHQFYVKLPEGNLEAHLVSEGYRKIAGLLYLLNNGSLTQNGILFWDEPEANLNPRMVVNIVEALKLLAASGMQIFIATHDYLLSQELSLMAEYSDEVKIRFFALYQPKRKAGVLYESGRTLADIDKNPILDEFAAHYDREARYFQTSKE
jgi:predicted ATPase